MPCGPCGPVGPDIINESAYALVAAPIGSIGLFARINGPDNVVVAVVAPKSAVVRTTVPVLPFTDVTAELVATYAARPPISVGVRVTVPVCPATD
jgi:hypothetical protein